MADHSGAARVNVYEAHVAKLWARMNASSLSLRSLASDSSDSLEDSPTCAGDRPLPALHSDRTDETAGAPMTFRAAGSKAGSHPHMPWQHSCFLDPYERVNIWSHGLPGVFFLLAAATVRWWAAAAPKPQLFFCLAASLTHLLSTMGHVYPDSHSLEKADHLGIVALIVGNPLSSLIAIEHGHIPWPMVLYTVLLLAGAFLPPAPRVAAFGAGITMIVATFGKEVYTHNLGVQLVLFAVAAVTFLRNAGHHRAIGWSDHHILHYVVTLACILQILNLFQLAARNDY